MILMSLQANRKRVVWLDLLRILSSCLVPMAHLCSNCLKSTAGVHSVDYITMNFYNSMCRWVVPSFVLISGVFFLKPERECDPKKIFKNNIVKMATAFIFWSFLYALQRNLFPPHAFAKAVPEFSKKAFVNDFISGEYHMWYLYMIAALYLVTPLIKVFTDHATKKQMEAFMVLSFLFTNVVPMLLCLPIVKKFDFSDVNNYISLGFVSGYTGLYIGGQYMVRHPFRKKVRIFVYAMGVLGYLMMSFGNLWLSFETGKPTKTLLAVSHAGSVMIAYAMFTFFQHVVSKIDFSERSVKVISWLSARTFGVYMCHVFLMRAFQYFGIQVIHFNPAKASVDLSHLPYVHIPPIIGVPALTLLVLIGSFTVSWIISKIPVLKKYVV